MRRRQYLYSVTALTAVPLTGCASSSDLRTTETGVNREAERLGVETTIVAPDSMDTQEITVRLQLLADGEVVAETDRRLQISGGQRMPIIVRFDGLSGEDRDRVTGAAAEVVR